MSNDSNVRALWFYKLLKVAPLMFWAPSLKHVFFSTPKKSCLTGCRMRRGNGDTSCKYLLNVAWSMEDDYNIHGVVLCSTM
jgi:hypothetical protein